jgi:hypothetical protein
MSKKEILTEVDNTITAFQQLISSFDEQQINKVPFEGSWTAGQVAQHIIMANGGFAEVLNGPVKNTEREADEMVKKIKHQFLDFTTRMKSPDFILPLNKEYHKDRLLKALEDIKISVSKAVDELDLSKTCLAFELPFYGHLTRLEAVYFVICHTQRHAHQLNGIKAKLPG